MQVTEARQFPRRSRLRANPVLCGSFHCLSGIKQHTAPPLLREPSRAHLQAVKEFAYHRLS